MKKPRIIGIVGGSCSGKTTLVTELKNRLTDSAETLSIDEYFIGSKRAEELGITDWESPDLYEIDRFIADLSKVRMGKVVTIPAKSRESAQVMGDTQKVIRPQDIILVEGFLIFIDERSRDLFDTKIFIDLPEEEVVRRRLNRSNGTSKWDDPEYIKNQLMPATRKYVGPQKQYADLVLDGTRPTSELAVQVMDFIKN